MLSQRSENTLSEVIDVEDLMTRCLGNIDFADRIITVFQSRCDADLVELEQAIEANDMARVERIAHRLKGACANAAARRMHDCATQLWTAANEKSVDDVVVRFGKLRQEWSKTTKQLSQFNNPASMTNS